MTQEFHNVKTSQLLRMLNPDAATIAATVQPTKTGNIFIDSDVRANFRAGVDAEIDRRFPVVPVAPEIRGYGGPPPPVVLDFARLSEIAHNLTSRGDSIYGVTAAEVTAMAHEIAAHRSGKLCVPPPAPPAVEEDEDERGRAEMGDDW